MTIATSASAELPAGYYLDPGGSGAWMSLPWPGDRRLAWDHPDRIAVLPASIGPQVIRWGQANLVHHLTGLPWRYTPGQKRFLILWYAVDEDLRWLYRRGIRRGAKGTGKDPFAAAWAVTELCGPVRPLDWHRGRPVGFAHRLALVQIAANSEAQAGDVLRVANAMCSLELIAEHGLDRGITRTQTDTGSKIELLTSSEASAEGDPATAIALNESHHMTTANGGMRVANVAQRNVGKSPKDLQARLIAFTNAHQQGTHSRGEVDYDAWQLQVSGRTRSKKVDILYDTVEADPGLDLTDPAQLLRGIQQAYVDAHWRDEDRLVDEASDPTTSVADLIRYYLNGLAAAEDAWVDPQRFDTLTDATKVVSDGDRISLFLDCSKSEDATGLMACRLADSYVFEVGIWQRPHGDRGKGWLAPRAEVDAKVRETFARFDVVWFGVDPSPARDDADEALYWQALTDAWHRDFMAVLPVWATPGPGGNSVVFDMRLSAAGGVRRNQAFTEAAMSVARMIDEDGLAGPLRHDGSPALRVHVHNARRRPNQWGMSLGKTTRDSHQLVDLAVCMVGAVMGARIALNSSKLPKPKTGKGRVAMVL